MQPELRVYDIPTDEVVPYAGNAKDHPDWQVDQIAESIRQFGFSDPVGVWHDAEGRPVIVEGHGRVMAAKALGLPSVPCVALDHLDDEGRRAYALAHNQTTMNSGWDQDALVAELDAIDMDMAPFGFEDMGEEDPLEDMGHVVEDDPPDDVEARAERGDVWQLGAHVLACGDATDPADVARAMGGRTADMLLTDPPYNVGYVGKTAEGLTIENDAMGGGDYQAFVADALEAARANMRAGAAFYVWFAAWRTPEVYGAARDAGLEVRQALYWVKNCFVLGRQDYQWQTEPCIYGWVDGAAHWFAPTRCERNVIDDQADFAKMKKAELVAMLEEVVRGGVETDAIREARPFASREHPTMKPVRLFARLMRNSTREGETVLDPFAGSGSTIIAAEQMGRVARCVELDPHYVDVALSRWEAFTGRRAVRVAHE